MPGSTHVEERAPYGRSTAREQGRETWTVASPSAAPAAPRLQSPHRYEGPTYYDLSPLKAPHYGTLVTGYLFLGGVAGGAQVISQVADLVGGAEDRSVVRHGRYLALGGSAVGPLLLMADLHTPQRWYNMLRIARSTSAMSIGAWTLVGFGVLSGGTAAAQWASDRTGRAMYRHGATAVGLPAAAAGAMMSTYTGTLLAATSVPIWMASGKLLPPLFAASAFNSAAAGLLIAESLRPDSKAIRPLQRLAITSAGVEAVLHTALDRRLHRQQVDQPLKATATARATRLASKLLGMATPLLVHGACAIARRPHRKATLTAAAATLVGGLLTRRMLLTAGRQSAQNPQDYFYQTMPKTDQRKPLEPAPDGPSSATAAAEQVQQKAASPYLDASPLSIEELIHQAVNDLQRAVATGPADRLQEVEKAEYHLTATRNAIIAQLRGTEHKQSARQQEMLDLVNAALSYIVSIEYPSAGVRASTIENSLELVRQVQSILQSKNSPE